MRPRRVLALVLAALLVLVLGACSSIPTSGPVNLGAAQNQQVTDDVGFVATGPTASASKADIVTGFLYAATGQQHDYRVARSFMTADEAKSWSPSTGVLVHDGGYSITASRSDDTVVFTVPVVATVAANGAYTELPQPKTRRLSFSLVKVAGQWRISHAENGVVLARANFEHLFTPRPLEFFNPAYTRLVPDLRWFPLRPDVKNAVSKSIVEALVSGAAGALATPVTSTAIPAGTIATLTGVSDGVARVNLQGAGDPSTAVLRRIKLQLTASLRDAKSISRVQLSVGGESRQVADLSIGTTPVPDPRPIVLSGGVFGYLADNRVAPLPDLDHAVAALRPTAVTVSATRGVAAALTSAGVEAVTKRTHVVVDARQGLIAPSLDADGWIYSVPKDAPDAVQAHTAKGVKSPMNASIPGVASITSIEVSRDGARLLVLAATASDSPRAFVFGIVRDAKGAPVGLSTTAMRVAAPGEIGVSATWVSDSAVAVLTASTGNQDGDDVTQQQVGGEATSPTPYAQLGAVSAIVGSSTQSTLTALLPSGEVDVWQGGVWQPAKAHADLVAVQR